MQFRFGEHLHFRFLKACITSLSLKVGWFMFALLRVEFLLRGSVLASEVGGDESGLVQVFVWL